MILNLYLQSLAERVFKSPPGAFPLASTYPSMSTPGDAGIGLWRNTVTLSSHSSPALSVEIRATFELGRMLGGGEVIGALQMSWDELLNHGDEPFDLSFPRVRGVHPSVKLKAAVVHACDHQDDVLFDASDSLADGEIARDTDAGHAQFAKYVRRKTVSHLSDAVDHFQLVLDRCSVSHPDHATALTNLAWARLQGYIRDDLQTSMHYFPLPRYPRIASAASSRSSLISIQSHPSADLAPQQEKYCCRHPGSCQLYHELLPLCPEGTYLRIIAAGKNGVDRVIGGCNNLPTDASDEGIHLRRVVLELCPLGPSTPSQIP
ncbi:uncharacterized protein F5891DRAFT_1258341 [Suillus fuscotomentosus]|uniref:Uncharacterized protein n=1 Tax=Suillus fuscotomentosus TaxID=1912939 RepID=A0AAD4HFM5_9AGAM|nr:uncharacterized protein F5891DRAFT_1258341 [Suillus fuscotomentosus]KAG1893729.1 hypothetical protein F5891DRAFT_1258341 [Suillus fuscotomentosus]